MQQANADTYLPVYDTGLAEGLLLPFAGLGGQSASQGTQNTQTTQTPSQLSQLSSLFGLFGQGAKLGTSFGAGLGGGSTS